ncbi:uncharacterized protein N7446_007856 [Penicillium canescens]|uniref:uncharacterized protein n=1 Tax=Penicillium canescens TaxID=5083 RepID=UPI0026DEA920|nr:uncharacterized protein N7446_007856 [Penicillium canescens]KAJ6058273.1 hypothetical protein N7446_007856 [Penicillium canescens]
MPKARWPQAEADNLLPWLSRHQHLSWKAKSVAYIKQYDPAKRCEASRTSWKMKLASEWRKLLKSTENRPARQGANEKKLSRL